MQMDNSRFKALEKPIDEYIIEQENKNTRSKTARDVKLLTEFLRENHEDRKPEEIEPKQLNEYLCVFILSVKRKDGKDYEPSSLRGLIASFNRYLKECKYSASIIEHAAFERTRKCLEAKSKELKKEGKGNKANSAKALTDEEVKILFQKNLLGISSAEALANTLWLFNSQHFGLRGCDEHRQMCWGDVKLVKQADGTEYLQYSERQTKTRTGAEPLNVRPILPKAFATPDLPRERDPVAVYKVYSEKRPESMNKLDSPFYLGLNHTKGTSDKMWFKAYPMGVNKLNSLMRTMAEKAGIENVRLTNHSARKRMIQKLNDRDVAPTHIMQLSGHRNVQSINNYSHVSEQQQKNMSRILSGSSTLAAETEARAIVNTTTTQQQNAISTPSGLFYGAVFNGGNFTININTSNSSTTSLSTTEEHQKHSFKRIKRILDSSDDDDSPPLSY